MHPGIKSKSAITPAPTSQGINILQKLSLILEFARIFKAGAVLQSRNVAAEHAGPASWHTAHEHILAIPYLFLVHSQHSTFVNPLLLTAKVVHNR